MSMNKLAKQSIIMLRVLERWDAHDDGIKKFIKILSGVNGMFDE